LGVRCHFFPIPIPIDINTTKGDALQVQKWLLNEEYPAIEQRAKQEGAQIHWGDETGARNDCQLGRSYAPKGHTPVKKSMSKRFSVNMISTVTNQERWNL
jgi:hypothetical protein